MRLCVGCAYAIMQHFNYIFVHFCALLHLLVAHVASTHNPKCHTTAFIYCSQMLVKLLGEVVRKSIDDVLR